MEQEPEFTIDNLKIESDPNPFPELEVLPRLRKLGSTILGFLHFLPDKPLASHGDHYHDRVEV